MSPPLNYRTGNETTEPDVQTRLDHLEAKLDRALTILEGNAANLSASLVSRVASLETLVKVLMAVCSVTATASIGAVAAVVVKFVMAGGMSAGVK